MQLITASCYSCKIAAHGVVCTAHGTLGRLDPPLTFLGHREKVTPLGSGGPEC